MVDETLSFRSEDSALIRFGDAGRAPILNYDVPQPAEYNGRFYLELELEDSAWLAEARAKPPAAPPPSSGTTGGRPAGGANPRNPGAQPTKRPTSPLIVDADRIVRETVLKPSATVAVTANAAGKVKGQPTSKSAQMADALISREGEAVVASKLDAGYTLVERRTFDNRSTLELKEPQDPAKMRPRVAIVHCCRLSSFLGEYGAGRTISTFSLLPGEQHEIEVKTYKRSKETTTEASSILDSFEETSAEEFQNDLTSENTTQDSEEKNFTYHAEAEASASWGWGSAKVSGGVEGGKSSKHEEFAKNVASTTQKHAATAASKRQIEINTSSQTETEQGEEQASRRTIENINVGRTLNFVFRQMNQVFVSVLHVTDVRLAFLNGDPAAEREYALSELEELLEEKVKPEARTGLRDAIWNILFTSFDWKGNLRPLVEAVRIDGKGTTNPKLSVVADRKTADFWRFRRQAATLDPLEDGAAVTVPGMVLNVTKSTLPTDGVVVDALLGQGNALDAYSMGLQMAAVDEKAHANRRMEAETELLLLKAEAIRNKDAAQVELIAKLLNPPPANSDG